MTRALRHQSLDMIAKHAAVVKTAELLAFFATLANGMLDLRRGAPAVETGAPGRQLLRLRISFPRCRQLSAPELDR
jgi:hypothetical protein